MEGSHLKLAEGLGETGQRKNKLSLLHQFGRLYQHPLLLTSSGDEHSVQELKAASSKLQAILEVLHLVRKRGEKAILFARHKDVQRMLARVLSEEFKRPVRILNGDTPRLGSAREVGAEGRSQILENFADSSGFDIVVLSPFVAGIGQTKKVHVYMPILEDRTGQISRTYDQLLDEMMDRKKTVAQDTLQSDDFLTPKENEDDLGVQIFTDLADSVKTAGQL
jgi:SNF2 family DNA or RNA helicase